MMSGYNPASASRPVARPRRYSVVPRSGGWSIVVGDAFTRPFPDRHTAVRIARQLQSQANRLNRPARPH